MNVCITGAQGKVGRSLIAHLTEADNLTVRAFARRIRHEDTPAAQRPMGVEWIEGDLDSPIDCDRLIDGQDVVIHLASRSVPLTSDQDIASDVRLNVIPSLNLLQAIRRSQRSIHLIFSSSGGAIYGQRAVNHPISEGTPCAPVSSYGIQKLAIEHYIRMLGNRGHLTASILRISTAYGWIIPPMHQQGFVGIALHQALHGSPIRLLGNPHNVRDYVFIDDVCSAFKRCIDRRPADVSVINIGSGEGRSVLQVVSEIETIFGHPLATQHEERQAAAYLPDWCVLDITHAAKTLGWRPTTCLHDGILMTLKRSGHWSTRASKAFPC